MQVTLFYISFLLYVGFHFVGSNVSLRISPSGLIVPRVEDALNITCEIFANDAHPVTYKLEWVVPTLSGLASSRRNLTQHRNSLTLQIHRVQEADSGVYLCNASIEGGVSLVANVTVTVKPKKGTCSQNFFLCGSKECIARRFLCDGLRDCPDGSDESESLCGSDPCQGKIQCDDGRCLNRNNCCNPSLDAKCRGYHLRCCSSYLEQLTGPPGGLMDEDKRYENDMGFLQSTIYTIIGCAVAFIFIVTIMVVAVCRVHMKQAAMTPHPRTLVARSALYWAHRPPHDLDAYLRESGSGSLRRSPYPPSANLLVTYNINNGIQLVGRMVEPPPYSEVADEPPADGPPPPYSSAENLRQLPTASGSAVSAAPAAESAGRSNSALLRPNVLVSRPGGND